MENKTGMPEFDKAYSPRKAFKLTRAMYQELLGRIEVLEGKKEPDEEAPIVDSPVVEQIKEPTKKELVEQAKELGVTGADRMSKDDVIKAIDAATAAKESE